jgi:hypothetical protein
MFNGFQVKTSAGWCRSRSYDNALTEKFHMVEPADDDAPPAAVASKERILRVYSPNFTALIISIARGRGKSMTIVSNNRPGRADITKTKSERNTAS